MVALGHNELRCLRSSRQAYHRNILALAVLNLFCEISLQWRHNERDCVSIHQPHDCLLNRLSKAQIKENIKAARHWPLWGEFPTQRASNAEITSSWKLYLHFLLSLNIELVPAVSDGWQRPSYTTYPTSLLWMPWRRKDPGHQQP